MITVHTSDPACDETIRDAIRRGEEVTVVAGADISAAAMIASGSPDEVKRVISQRLADAVMEMAAPARRGPVIMGGGVCKRPPGVDGEVDLLARGSEQYLPTAVYECLRAKTERKATRPRWRQ